MLGFESAGMTKPILSPVQDDIWTRLHQHNAVGAVRVDIIGQNPDSRAILVQLTENEHRDQAWLVICANGRAAVWDDADYRPRFLRKSDPVYCANWALAAAACHDTSHLEPTMEGGIG